MIRNIINYFKAQKQELPSVKSFVFGLDEDAIKKVIMTFGDYYMFVDLGQFDSSTTNGTITDTFVCAVTIAMPQGTQGHTDDETIERVATSFDLIASLRKSMFHSSREKRLKHLSAKHEILPFQAPHLNNSVGWSLVFRISGPDLLEVKGV